MQSKWRKVKLGEVCKIRRGSSPRPIVDFMAESGMPWVKISDATESHSRFIEKTNEFIKLDGVKKSVIVEEGDLILSNSGTAGLPKFMKITACIHDGWQTFTDLDGIDKEFLYYSLINIRSKLLHNAYDSTMKNLTLDMVRDAEIILPKLEEQQRISAFLSTIDSKLEINQNINQTLEEMAQSIFKSWFVDFDPVKAKMNGEQPEGMDEATAALFPDKLVESELGLIPEGWNIQPLSDVSRVINGRAYKNSEFREKGTPIVRIQNLTGAGKTVYSDIDLPQDKLIDHGDLIFAWSATFGPYLWRGPKSIYHYHIWKMEVDENKFGKYLLFMHLARLTEYLKNQGTGSIFTHLTKGIMESQKLVVPFEGVVQAFAKVVTPLFVQIDALHKQNKTLESLREILLPKLLSGELELEQTEELAEVS